MVTFHQIIRIIKLMIGIPRRLDLSVERGFYVIHKSSITFPWRHVDDTPYRNFDLGFGWPRHSIYLTLSLSSLFSEGSLPRLQRSVCPYCFFWVVPGSRVPEQVTLLSSFLHHHVQSHLRNGIIPYTKKYHVSPRAHTYIRGSICTPANSHTSE